jgi:hypothetical protein
MIAIWKYELALKERPVLDLPRDAKILHFDNQSERPCIWVEVVDAAVAWDTAPRKFRLAGTGHELGSERREYIGSALFSGGALVFHLYEIF